MFDELTDEPRRTRFGLVLFGGLLGDRFGKRQRMPNHGPVQTVFGHYAAWSMTPGLLGLAPFRPPVLEPHLQHHITQTELNYISGFKAEYPSIVLRISTTFGDRAFIVARPRIWNSLLHTLRDPSQWQPIFCHSAKNVVVCLIAVSAIFAWLYIDYVGMDVHVKCSDSVKRFSVYSRSWFRVERTNEHDEDYHNSAKRLKFGHCLTRIAKFFTNIHTIGYVRLYHVLNYNVNNSWVGQSLPIRQLLRKQEHPPIAGLWARCHLSLNALFFLH